MASPPSYGGSASDGVLRALAAALADPDAGVARAARGGFATAARAARRPATLVGVEALRAARTRAAAATGRSVADPQALALLPLLADVVRDAPPGSLDDAVRAAVRAAALGACLYPLRTRGSAHACACVVGGQAACARTQIGLRRVCVVSARPPRAPPAGAYRAPRGAASAPCVA
jgi:hypothetical protein